MSFDPIQTEISQLLDLEDVQREELRWSEEQHRCGARILFLKRCKLIQRRHDEDDRKLKQTMKRSLETCARRMESLEVEEQRKRLDIMNTESLRLEGVLRSLEKNIRDDVFNSVYEMQQKIKYFNKTVDAILRREFADRNNITGSERYEWLVMVQKFDGQSTRILHNETIDRVRQEKAAKHDRVMQELKSNPNTLSQRTAQWQSVASPVGALESSFNPTGEEGENNTLAQDISSTASSALEHRKSPRQSTTDLSTGPSSPTQNSTMRTKHRVPQPPAPSRRKSVRRKIDCKLDLAHLNRMLDLATQREEEKRQQTHDEEAAQWATFTSFVDFVLTRVEQAKQPEPPGDELRRCIEQRITALAAKEQHDRRGIEGLQDITFRGARTKYMARIRHEEARITEADHVRQVCHDQRLAHRYQRIAMQQNAFAERERAALQDILAIRREDMPIAVTSLGPVETQAQRHFRERRLLEKAEEADRRQLLQEENTYIHIMYAEAMADLGFGNADDAKQRAAGTRRAARAQHEQERLLRKLDETTSRQEQLFATQRSNDRVKYDVERVCREEAAARVKLSAEHQEWVTEVSALGRGLVKSSRVLASVEEHFFAERKVLLAQERRMRQHLLESLKLGLRPRTKKPPPPLPLPPVDFHKAKALYASVLRSASSRPQGPSSARPAAPGTPRQTPSGPATARSTPVLPPIDAHRSRSGSVASNSKAPVASSSAHPRGPAVAASVSNEHNPSAAADGTPRDEGPAADEQVAATQAEDPSTAPPAIEAELGCA